MFQKSKMDTTIDFVKTPKYYSENIIWNRKIITLVVRIIELDGKKNSKTKCVLLKFKISEKIKQVSSTKLTNWYKSISR
jgi:hypothetical protein